MTARGVETDPAPSDDQLGTLICTLVDRRSSVPLSDARVSCVVGGTRLIQVDVDTRGEFRAEFPEGVYELVISARGELSLILRGIGILGGHTQRMLRAFVPGEDDGGNDGEPASAIGGYLVDRLNHPVAEAAITATARHGNHKYTGASDKLGAYILHNVKPGEYDVTVRTATNTLSNERIVIQSERLFHRHDLKLMITI